MALVHDGPGSVDFGFIDSTKYSGDIVYAPVVQVEGYPQSVSFPRTEQNLRYSGFRILTLGTVELCLERLCHRKRYIPNRRQSGDDRHIRNYCWATSRYGSELLRESPQHPTLEWFQALTEFWTTGTSQWRLPSFGRILLFPMLVRTPNIHNRCREYSIRDPFWPFVSINTLDYLFSYPQD